MGHSPRAMGARPDLSDWLPLLGSIIRALGAADEAPDGEAEPAKHREADEAGRRIPRR